MGHRIACRQCGHLEGSAELLDTRFANVPPDIREIRVRADAGFGFHPVFEALESRPTQYAVVARLTQAFRRLLPGLGYESVNRDWEMADLEQIVRTAGPEPVVSWSRGSLSPRRKAQTTLFALGRYAYRAWVTNLPLTPAGVWHFYDDRATMEVRIAELREDYALRKIPTRSFQARSPVPHHGQRRALPDRLPFWRYVTPDVHISFFEPETLARALRTAGFEPGFPGFGPGWADIIRFKTLKSLRRHHRSASRGARSVAHRLACHRSPSAPQRAARRLGAVRVGPVPLVADQSLG